MLLLDMLERYFVFFPVQTLPTTPGDTNLTFEDVFFLSADQYWIHGWFIPGTSKYTLLWFHGNGGNIGHRMEEILIMHHSLGINIFIFDYRGYGRSEGKPSEQGVYQDATAAIKYIQNRPEVDSDRIIYFGRSLGAAIAIHSASALPPAGMILVAPFTSLSDIASLKFPHLPLKWLTRNRYNTISKIQKVHTSLLIMHGDLDDVVPLTHSSRIFDTANQPKRLRVLVGAGHNDTHSINSYNYWNILKDFINTID